MGREGEEEREERGEWEEDWHGDGIEGEEGEVVLEIDGEYVILDLTQ